MCGKMCGKTSVLDPRLHLNPVSRNAKNLFLRDCKSVAQGLLTSKRRMMRSRPWSRGSATDERQPEALGGFLEGNVESYRESTEMTGSAASKRLARHTKSDLPKMWDITSWSCCISGLDLNGPAVALCDSQVVPSYFEQTMTLANHSRHHHQCSDNSSEARDHCGENVTTTTSTTLSQKRFLSSTILHPTFTYQANLALHRQLGRNSGILKSCTSPRSSPSP